MTDLGRRIASRHPEVQIGVDVPAERGARFGIPRELAVYRVAQEAITNAIRHGEAPVINVEMSREPRLIVLRVSDDGAGFDPASVTLGFGLLGMRERAELASGALEIRSEVGVGTVIELRLPLG